MECVLEWDLEYYIEAKINMNEIDSRLSGTVAIEDIKIAMKEIIW